MNVINCLHFFDPIQSYSEQKSKHNFVHLPIFWFKWDQENLLSKLTDLYNFAPFKMEINKLHCKLHSQNGSYKCLWAINNETFLCPHQLLDASAVPPCSKFEAQAICDHHPLEPNFLSSVLALIFSIFCKRRTYIYQVYSIVQVGYKVKSTLTLVV